MDSKTSSRWHLVAGLAGLVAIGTAVALALLHLRDLSRIQHITGVWMGLAAALDGGVLYPPLDDDGFYGGTRYMPAVFALIAALARLTGDILVAAKLTALLTTLALAAGLAAVVRRVTGRWGDAVFIAGVFLVLPEGVNALLTPHADALSAALAVWGLFLLDSEDSSSGRLLLVAALFALALLTKFSAITGPAAAGLYLFARGQRIKAIFIVGPFAVLTVLGMLAFGWASDGRMADNFRALASGGMSGESVRIGPARLLLVLTRPTPFLLLWPVALFLLLPLIPPPPLPVGQAFGPDSSACQARKPDLRAEGEQGSVRRWSIWEWYLLCALGTTLVIFTSPGTEFNHLVELQVACLIVLARRLPLPGLWEKGLGGQGVRLLGGGALAWGLLSLLGAPDPSAISVRELARVVPADSRILSEDASVPLVLGQRPVVLDPFSYRILAQRGRVDDELLAARVRAQEFDALVMLARVDRPDESLCPRFHFGPAVTAAMLRAYRYQGRVGRYHVYRPVGPSLACPASPRRGEPAAFSPRSLMHPAHSCR